MSKAHKEMPLAGSPEDIEAMGWISYKEHCLIRDEYNHLGFESGIEAALEAIRALRGKEPQ